MVVEHIVEYIVEYIVERVTEHVFREHSANNHIRNERIIIKHILRTFPGTV